LINGWPFQPANAWPPQSSAGRERKYRKYQTASTHEFPMIIVSNFSNVEDRHSHLRIAEKGASDISIQLTRLILVPI
jgi:hypothetical protein